MERLGHCSPCLLSQRRRHVKIALVGLCLFIVSVVIYITFSDQKYLTLDTISIYPDTAQSTGENHFTHGNSRNVAVNPHNFKVIINEPDSCQYSDTNEVFLLILIHSKPSHGSLRNIQRETCLATKKLHGKRIVTVYLLGISSDTVTNRLVEEESAKYHDILVSNFRDSYRNLTLKLIMGMKWTSEYCPKARFILKGDDDVYFSLDDIIKSLSNVPGSGAAGLMAGYVYRSATPYRNINSKWYITEKVYPHQYYPPFCRGYAYILSGELPAQIYKISLQIPFFPLDDVFMGFCAKRLNIKPVSKRGFVGPGKESYSFCSFKLSFAVHVTNSENIPQYWQEQQSKKHFCNYYTHYLFSIF